MMAEVGMRFKCFARAVLYTFSMYIITHLVVFSLLPLALLIVTFWPERIPSLKQWFVKVLFKIVGKELRVEGLHNVRAGGKYLVISNYPSFYAGFALMGLFPDASLVAHAFIARIPLLGQLARRVGTIFVRPGKGRTSRRAIDMGLEREGEIGHVIIFPEGERTPDGEIHKFKRGFIYILRQSSLNLLPVTLSGLYELKPVKRFHLDPDAEPAVVIHEPIAHADVIGMSDGELLELAVSTIGGAYTP